MSSWKAIPAKSLCRIFAILNMFVGVIAILYWSCLQSVTRNFRNIGWKDMLFFLDDKINISISENCGNDYLGSVSPTQLADLIENSLEFYLVACMIFGAKGLAQFFVTCCRPCMVIISCIHLLIIDLLASSLMLFGLCKFRQPELCALEYSDIFHQSRLQTKMTAITFAIVWILKLPELIALICLIRDQKRLLAKGERRSKGVRRSDAFRTPMTSRANSYLGEVFDKDETVALHQVNSDEDEEDDDDIKFFARNDKCKFIEIELTEGRNNNEANQNSGDGDITDLKLNNTKFHH
ncbi:unnamed protein product [Orchesella dallaii]|uniref:Uncharacterized protein n=1 Tax=Orchesella dallaii TaxID=48710 RepID=A0ABP1QBF0_9HEXA